MIDRELIEEIRAQNDISQIVSGYVQLRRQGASMVGLCPFHNEKTPSFHVMQDRQSFHCFGCGAGGNVITFVMMIENYEFLDAVKFLAEKANIVIEQKGDGKQAALLAEKKKKLYEINKKAARFYYDCLNEEQGRAASNYVRGRGLSRKTSIKCGLGYSPRYGPPLYSYLSGEGYDDEILIESGLIVRSKSETGFYDRFFDRLIFPIFDITGKVAGFGGRSLGDGMPKYLNSPETPVFEKGKLLYGLNFARSAKKREFIVVEGYMDAISMYQAGFMNTVASLGTAFTSNHAKLLKSYCDTVILLYDSDEAGVKAVYKAFPQLVGAGLKVKVAQTKDAKDPDEYIRKYGADKLSELLAAAKNHIEFQIDDEKKKHNISESVEQRVEFTKQAARILKTAGSEIERDAYIKETARLTGISEDAIRKEAETPEERQLVIRQRRTREDVAGDAPKNIITAQKHFLGLVANNAAAYRKSLSYIDETYFTNETYKQLYELIGNLHNDNKIVRAEQAACYFDTVDKQTEVTRILTVQMPDTSETEKVFNHQLRTIIEYHLENKKRVLEEENDANAVLNVLNEMKSVKRLYISLTDG